MGDNVDEYLNKIEDNSEFPGPLPASELVVPPLTEPDVVPESQSQAGIILIPKTELELNIEEGSTGIPSPAPPPSEYQTELECKFDELKHISNTIKNYINILKEHEICDEAINYRLHEAEIEFNMELNKLKDVRRDPSTGSQISLSLDMIEEKINELRYKLDKHLAELRVKKKHLQKNMEELIIVMDNQLHLLKEKYIVVLLNLEQKISSSEYIKEVKNYRDEITNFLDLQQNGWLSFNINELFQEALNKHNLKVTDSGFITKSGTHITFKGAQQRRYFDALALHYLDLPTNEEEKISTPTMSEPSLKQDLGSVLSQISSEEINYLKQTVGSVLTLAITEITMKKPKDPIHYLGHYLLKYRFNQEMSKIQKKYLDQINEERQLYFEEKRRKFILETAQLALWEIIRRAEYEIYLRELERQMAMLGEGEGEGEDMSKITIEPPPDLPF